MLHPFHLESLARQHRNALYDQATRDALARARPPGTGHERWASTVLLAPVAAAVTALPETISRPEFAFRITGTGRRRTVEWFDARRFRGTGTISIEPAGDTWSEIVVRLTAETRGRRRLDRAAWALVGLVREQVEAAGATSTAASAPSARPARRATAGSAVDVATACR